MATDDTVRFTCSNPNDLVHLLNQFNLAHPIETRKKIARICSAYTRDFGQDGAVARFNGRTADEILAEYLTYQSQDSEQPELLASGEVDGIKYALYEASDARRSDTLNEPTG